MALGRSILDRPILKTERVFIPEWDGEIIIRQLTGAEVKALQPLALQSVDIGSKEIRNADAMNKFRYQLVARSWIDEDGQRVIGDNELSLLDNQAFSVIERIANAAAKLNNLMGFDSEIEQKN
jgi:hypothetical protein